jgi:hypothetical protein
MEPADADRYFGKTLRTAAKGTRLARAQTLSTFFAYLELRHKVEIHALTGRVVECPIDEMNKPRGRKQAALRIPPTDAEITTLFAGWRGELVTCRKFAPTARDFVAAKLMSQVGLRVNEVRTLASRRVVTVAGSILVILGLIPKIGEVVASLPGPVIGSVSLVMFATVAGVGISTLAKVDFSGTDNLLIVSLAVGIGMIPIAAPQVYTGLPAPVQIIFGGAITSTVIVAFMLNLAFHHLTPANADVA